MKVDSNIIIERESLSLEKKEDNLWELSLEGRTYFIHYIGKKFLVEEVCETKKEGYGGVEIMDSYIILGKFDDAYEVARFFIQKII